MSDGALILFEKTMRWRNKTVQMFFCAFDIAGEADDFCAITSAKNHYFIDGLCVDEFLENGLLLCVAPGPESTLFLWCMMVIDAANNKVFGGHVDFV